MQNGHLKAEKEVEESYGDRLWGLELDVGSSVLCQMMGFGISGVESPASSVTIAGFTGNEIKVSALSGVCMVS
jgi:hypothetical protein